VPSVVKSSQKNNILMNSRKDMGKLIHEAMSEHILGAAMAVLNELKPGLDEKLYENALII
jgi:hypothetical protein